MCTIWGIRLNVNPVYTVIHIEVIHIDCSGEGFEGREYIRHRKAQKLDFVAVGIKIELRDIRLHSGGESSEFLTFRRIMEQCVGGVL